MPKKDLFTKIVAISGSVFVWIPILSPLLFSLALLIARRIFRFDYLMPAEFFPVALLGGALLLWAALRARSRRALVGWSLGIAAFMLVSGQLLAVVTGLASGETEPAGLPWVLVVSSIAIYTLALLALGVGSILLLRDLFKSSHLQPSNLQD